MEIPRGPLTDLCTRSYDCFPTVSAQAWLSSVFVEGEWIWPRSSDPEADQIRNLAASPVKRASSDRPCWGDFSQIMTYVIWYSISEKRQQVTWWKILRSPGHLPRTSLTSWLAILDKLSTKDRVAGRVPIGNPLGDWCCKEGLETRDHLFFLAAGRHQQLGQAYKAYFYQTERQEVGLMSSTVMRALHGKGKTSTQSSKDWPSRVISIASWANVIL